MARPHEQNHRQQPTIRHHQRTRSEPPPRRQTLMSITGSSRTRTNNPPESTPQRIQTRPERDLNGGGRKSMDKANVRTGCSYLRAEPQGSEEAAAAPWRGGEPPVASSSTASTIFPRVAPGRGVSPFPPRLDWSWNPAVR